MKKTKKLLAGLMAAVLALAGPAPAFALEGSAAEASEGKKAEGYKLGTLALGSLTTTFQAATLALQDMCDEAGVELVEVNLTGYDDQGFLTAYESMIDMGVDGCIVYTFAEGVIQLIADLFEDAGVDWFLANRQISDPDLRDYVFSTANLTGNCYCTEEEIAYNIVKELNEDYEVENLAVIGLTEGDVNGDLRDIGIENACEDFGLNLLTETRGIATVDDVTNSVEAIISTYPEVDGIFIVGGNVTTGALAGACQALANHDMSDKVAIGMIDISAGMSEYMGEGNPLKIVAGGNLVMDYVVAGASMINQFCGVNSDETPYVLSTNMMYIYDSEDAVDYDEYCENVDVPIISGDAWYDTLLDQDLESMQEFISNFSIAKAKELHE